MKTEQPGSYDEAAELLRAAAADGRRVRFRGGGTKLGWGRPVPEPDLEICTGGLDRVLEHNAGDFTAVLQAGHAAVRGAGRLRRRRTDAGARPAVVAVGRRRRRRRYRGGRRRGDDRRDRGHQRLRAAAPPLRRRAGPRRRRDRGLSDGTVARAGGKVIKNVAGYDLGKLFAGAFGTLGLIAEVTVRLHPRPAHTATVVARSSRPGASWRRPPPPWPTPPWKPTASTCGGTPPPNAGAGASVPLRRSADPGPAS